MPIARPAAIHTVRPHHSNRATARGLLDGWPLLVVMGLAVLTVLAQGVCRRRGGRASTGGTVDSLPDLSLRSSSSQEDPLDRVEAELQQMLADAQTDALSTRMGRQP
jgi:hypothetical protein